MMAREDLRLLRHLRPLSLLSLLLLFFLGAAEETLAGGRKSSGGNVPVRGYFRKDGTYVAPHVRSAPDGNPYNNYSYPGNFNPNTGTITPGNPDTYLDKYYNRKPSGSFPGGSVTVPSLNSSPPSASAGPSNLGEPSQHPTKVPPPVSTGNLGVHSPSDGPVSMDRVPAQTWRGPPSLDR